MLTDILARSSKMPVHKVENDMWVEPDNVYVIPPDVSMTIEKGFLKLQRSVSKLYRPVDGFLVSLARDLKNLAIGVILSGTGADGTEGIKAIYAEGGITFAQDEESAKYPGMPHSAIASDSVLFVLPPQRIAEELVRIGRHPHLSRPRLIAVKPEEKESDGLRSILTMLKLAYGVDFSYYKETTVNRRIARRMVIQKMEHIDEYVKYVRTNKAELQSLFDDMLIGVTSFFREPETFEVLKNRVFAFLVKDHPVNAPIRMWVPGCSSGEEVYSIAICLKEFMDKAKVSFPVQIFGTDVSEKNIEKARAGRYLEAITADVSPERLMHYFSKTDSVYQVIKPIRDMCIFAKQDLAKDPPFSNLDVISCRNVMIYFKPVLQKKLLPVFHYALKPRGYLVLGNSESVVGFDELFSPLDKTSVYMRKMTPAKVTFGIESLIEEPREAPAKKPALEKPLVTMQKAAERLIMSKYAPPNVLVNNDMEILSFRGNTGMFLEPAQGQASLNLLRMVKEDLRVDVQTAVYKARKDKMTVKHEGLKFKHNGETKTVNLEVIPISTPDSEENFFLVVFESVPPSARPSKPLRVKPGKPLVVEETVKDRQISDLKMEIASSKETLQTIIEEQEATNEELRAALEEVQSTNEELQSTNEELETSKEELQSTNEELNTLNDEVANRNRELSRAVNDLNNLFSNVNLAMIILDTDMRIRLFTPLADKLLRLTSSDVGRPFSDIRLDMSIPDLDKMISDVIDNLVSKEKEVQDSIGRWYLMRIRPYLTVEKKIDGAVLSFMDIDTIARGRMELERVKNYSETVMSTMREPLVVLDADFRIVSANKAFYEAYGAKQEDVEGRVLFELGGEVWDLPVLRERLGEVLTDGKIFDGFFVEHDFPTIGRRALLVNARPMAEESGHFDRIVLTFNDITELKRADEEIKSLSRFPSENPNVVMRISKDGNIIYSNRAGQPILDEWKCQIGQQVPTGWQQLVSSVLESGTQREVEEKHDSQTFLIMFAPIVDAGYVNIYGRNITERKKAEENLQRSEEVARQRAEELEKIMDLVPNAVWVSRDPECRVITGNRAANKFYEAESEANVSAGPITGGEQDLARRFFKDGRELKPEELPMQEAIVKDAEIRDSEIEVLLPSGKKITIMGSAIPLRDADGKARGCLASFMDITERKKAEEALRQSERKFKSLAENAPDVIMRFDTNLRVLYLNPQVESAIGIPAESFLGKTNEEMGMPPKLYELWNDMFHKAASSKQLQQAEFDISSPDGTRSFSLRIVPEFGEDGSLVSFLGISHDITDIKKAEDELRKARDELEIRVHERTRELSTASEKLQAASLYARSLIEASLDPLVTINVKGKITDVNKATEEATGFSREQLIGSDFSDYFTDSEEARKGYTRVFTEGFVRDYPLAIRHKSGKVTDVLYNAAVYRNEAGGIQGVFAAARDITERKHAEETVKAERKRFIDVMEKLPAYLILLTPDYHVSYANRFFRERFGEGDGRRCFEYLFGRSEACENCETYKTLEKMAPLEWEWTGPDGRNYYIYDSPFTDVDGSTLILEVGIDITERKKAEESLRKAHDELETRVDERTRELKEASEALRESEIDLNRAQAVARTGSWRLDVQRNRLLWSDETYNMFGVPKGTPLTYEAFLGYVHPDDREHVDQKWQAAIRGEPYDIEHRIVVNGETKWVREKAELEPDQNGKLQGGFGTVQDITERKQIEEKLFQSERKYRSLYETSMDGIASADMEGRITECNDAYAQMLGYSKDELKALSYIQLTPEKWHQMEQGIIREQVTKRGHSDLYEKELIRKDGSIVPVSIRVWLVRDEKWAPIGMWAIVQDVTRRKHLENELKRYSEHLEHLVDERTKKLKDAERLAAIGETAAMVGHDIRSPLQTVEGAIYLAKEEIKALPSRTQEISNIEEMLNSIHEETTYVNKIVSDLQDYARPLEPQLEEIDTKQLINGALATVHIPSTVEVAVTVEQNCCNMIVDPTMMKRILANLITNALQAMPDEGKLTIAAIKKQDEVHISVRDTGQGIPEENRAKIFQPLFSTKAKGQGFGLAVVKRLAEAHNGTIAFNTEVGKGTTFTVAIPLANEAS
jgi:PAS domain S-box-containing protein